MKQQLDNEFDRIFKKALFDYMQEPPDNILKRIKNSYKLKPATPSSYFYWIAGILIIGAIISGGSIIYHNINTKTDSAKIITGSDNNISNKNINYDDIFQKEFSKEATVIVNQMTNSENPKPSASFIEVSKNRKNGQTTQQDNINVISENKTDNSSLQIEDFEAFTKNNIKNSGIKLSSQIIAATCHKSNGSIRVSASGGNGKLSYIWLSGNIEPNITYITNLYPGTYQLKVTDGNNSEEIFTLQVPDSGIVAADFTFSENDLEISTPVYFTNQTLVDNISVIDLNGVLYLWTFGDDNNSSELNPSHVFKNAGTYNIRLLVTSTAGCTGAVEKSLDFAPVGFYVPSIFTPNGDGINDIYKVQVPAYQSFMTIIFSLTGKVVYTCNDPDEGWNGKIDGDDDASIGDYFIYVKYTGSDGKQFVKKSTFRLNR
ncbi:MAG: gliding motility-associated C-terminal domain-containing protein [Bacteroidia bacterium]|nr:gliding motility-associated C-terminal domain-containing protein [Bacteroidia bacterium]